MKAYFLHKEEAITEQSAMRLQAMADLHELGSGFDVANRDLEIRGAGSLLGTEQSKYIFGCNNFTFSNTISTNLIHLI